MSPLNVDLKRPVNSNKLGGKRFVSRSSDEILADINVILEGIECFNDTSFILALSIGFGEFLGILGTSIQAGYFENTLDIDHSPRRTKSDLRIIDVAADQDSSNICLDNEILS